MFLFFGFALRFFTYKIRRAEAKRMKEYHLCLCCWVIPWWFHL